MEGLFPAGPDQKVERGNRLHRNLPPAVPVVCMELFGNMSLMLYTNIKADVHHTKPLYGFKRLMFFLIFFSSTF